MQGATDWSDPSIMALFQPPIWQGPNSWGAPFADILIEFLEAKCEVANVEPVPSRADAVPSTAAHTQQPAVSEQQADSEDEEPPSDACLHRAHDDRTQYPEDERSLGSEDDSVSSADSNPPSAPQITAALLQPAVLPERRAVAKVSTACVEAQSSGAWRAAFEAVQPPAIGMGAYLLRIGRYSGCSTVCLVHACAYMLHLEACGMALGPLTVHRCLATALVLAVKHVEDVVWSNAHYARVTGISLTDLNRMELVMCCILDFSLYLPGPKDVLKKVRKPCCTKSHRTGCCEFIHIRGRSSPLWCD
jgi:hypothetical protein